MVIKKTLVLNILITLLGIAMIPFSALAAKDVAVPETPRVGSSAVNLEIGNVINPEAVTKYNSVSTKGVTSQAASSPVVAVMTIFADPTKTERGSSGLSIDSGAHAWITVRNTSNANIKVGKLTGIAPGKSVSVGNWGTVTDSNGVVRREEHAGLWYNLEAWAIYNKSELGGRISISYALTADELNELNSYISSNDRYSSATYNCATFAVGAWNEVVASYSRISASNPKTPKNVANAIKSKWPSYMKKGAVPYHYAVYYAQGGKAPKKSTQYK